MKRILVFISIFLIVLLISCKQAVDTNILPDIASGNQDNDPAWSPDGQTIVYSHFDTDFSLQDSLGRYQIWFINPDGSNRRYLTPGTNPAWSLDNQWLVYNVGSSSIIGKTRVDGSGFQQLTTNDDGDHGSYLPAWSSDGNRILFDIHGGPLSGVWVMNSDGSNKKKVVEWIYDPAWFPDGKRFAVRQYSGSHWQICIYDTNGTSLDTIVSYDSDYCISMSNPAVSADGQIILFDMSTIPTQNRIVYSINVDGSNLKMLTPAGGIEPCWSPDGQFICYAYSKGLKNRNNPVIDYKLWIMNADGSNKRQLTYD